MTSFERMARLERAVREILFVIESETVEEEDRIERVRQFRIEKGGKENDKSKG